jgi:Ca-activated chloride channel family protein
MHTGRPFDSLVRPTDPKPVVDAERGTSMRERAHSNPRRRAWLARAALGALSLVCAASCLDERAASQSEKGAAGSARSHADEERESTPQELVVEGAEDPRAPSPVKARRPAATATPLEKSAPSAMQGDSLGGGGIGLGGIGTLGHGAGPGTGQGFGSGSGRMGSAPKTARRNEGSLGPSAPPAPPIALTESVLDPNGRYATTYRPGAGHLAAFESAVALGIIPTAEREIVSDIGARYAPSIAAPTDQALVLQSDLERVELPPDGGPVHVRLTLRSTVTAAGDRPPVAIVVVLDTSGSMRGELIQSARDAAGQLVDKLAPGDRFSLVRFSNESEVLIPMTVVGAKKEQLKEKIAGIKEGGGTNIGEGLRLGYEQLAKKDIPADAVRVTMLLSDGRANDGITDRRKLARLALDAFETGIQTSAFGLGTDYDGPLMSQIANDGAGGYYYLPSGKQIAGALATELDKRLDPVATAVEVRVRLKPGIELLNVYGSRRLTADEAARVRTIEVAQDQQSEKRDKIKANRQDDLDGGLRFFIPAFARDDSHSILLKLRAPAGVGPKDLALVELKYKDRVKKKNRAEENPLKVAYANSDALSAATVDPSVRRTVQGFAAGEALTKAAQLVADGRTADAVELLGEREGLLVHAAATLGEPLFVEDAKRLARLRSHASDKGMLKTPLVLAMMMETAGSVHLR